MLLGSILTSSASGIHQSAADADGAAHGEVLLGKFFAGRLRSGINGGPGLVHLERLRSGRANLIFCKKSIVSRPAVPLPMAMASMPYFSTRCSTTRLAFKHLPSAAHGDKWRYCAGNCRWRSRQTTLQPVRKPGSMPSTAFSPRGAASSSWRRFSAKTRMASRVGFFFATVAEFRFDGGLQQAFVAVLYRQAHLIGGFPVVR